ncbi:MAG: rubrerythrin family protein [Candidatus Aminicenantes bacterium]|jgi:rubrerythrin|nr:rubrerythrin family protein [Candidatus Aminicenantes bacterium]MDH5385512.1 rubrerythrin family protein [Candidatus Aminicenantes bacterium]MDH5744173.1 rubrerythrin family protein [Candidatus Aminicenantes bacterium]
MKKMTEENLWNAFAGESQAHMKYMAFADKAERDNFPNVARLFRANSFAEQVHATNHLRTLSGIGKTGENLLAAIEGETFEVEEMYPAYVSVAKEQSEPGAETMTKWALAAEKVHAELYKKAKEAVDQSQDMSIESIHVCQVCGFTVEGEAPDVCPVCGSPKEKFKEF